MACGAFTAGYILIDFLRLKNNAVKSVFIIIFGSLIRRKELRSFTGGTYLLLALLLCMLVFDKEVFLAAAAFLIIGDTMAAITGQFLGRVRIFRKSLEGTLSNFLSCVLIALLLSKLPVPPTGVSLPLKIGVIGAICASIVELLPFRINDNVAIPVVAGTVMQIGKIVM